MVLSVKISKEFKELLLCMFSLKGSKTDELLKLHNLSEATNCNATVFQRLLGPASDGRGLRPPLGEVTGTALNLCGFTAAGLCGFTAADSLLLL
jgi:hypothetical protein